ncbi:hypothetical protein GCM10010365_14910 [Streptomyces poonensis]|uniref:Alpha-L-arabinofuranosidase B arabinose-binding domain-containing protein n=1 Tax=Streptomyces poonensis TaxID=68255 RepID=A0A918PBR5_9ACTN|nr:hypothetical protein GCM10010365_14910 [Streptomyces poonensis]
MRVLPFRPRPVGRGRPLPALLVRRHAGDEGHRAREPALTPCHLPEPWLIEQDATFHRVAGLADASWASFRSHNYPTRYVRHSDHVLRIDTITTATDRADATFSVGC